MIAKTYNRKSCGGSIRIVVNRDDNGKFCSVLIYPPAKKQYVCGEEDATAEEFRCGYSWAFAVQDLLTFALKRASNQREINLIIKAVSGQFCYGMPISEHKCRSCSDAISQALKLEFSND